MDLVTYARAWLGARGLYDEASDYGGMLGHAIERMVTGFAAEGHSGFSAAMARSAFNALLSDYEEGRGPEVLP